MTKRRADRYNTAECPDIAACGQGTARIFVKYTNATRPRSTSLSKWHARCGSAQTRRAKEVRGGHARRALALGGFDQREDRAVDGCA
jgi:hypothetical protein